MIESVVIWSEHQSLMRCRFASWRDNAQTELCEVKTLEQRKKQLAEHRLVLDLQHQAMFKQYQEILKKIGEFTPDVNPTKPKDYSIPDEVKTSLSLTDSVHELTERCRAATAEFDSLSKEFVRATMKEEIIKGTEESVGEAVKRPPLCSLPVLDTSGIIKAMEIEKEIEYKWKKVLFLTCLESKLSQQLDTLLEISERLVDERKWHNDTPQESGARCMKIVTDGFSLA